MLKKLFVSMTLFAALGLAQTAAAADECKADSDCKDGKVCILALNPHVCKAPQPAGAACKRDVVCASKKCEIPSGKDVGMCKYALRRSIRTAARRSPARGAGGVIVGPGARRRAAGVDC